MNWKILETENTKTARFEMPQKAKMTPEYKKMMCLHYFQENG